MFIICCHKLLAFVTRFHYCYGMRKLQRKKRKHTKCIQWSLITSCVTSCIHKLFFKSYYIFYKELILTNRTFLYYWRFVPFFSLEFNYLWCCWRRLLNINLEDLHQICCKVSYIFLDILWCTRVQYVEAFFCTIFNHSNENAIFLSSSFFIFHK